jgi:tetratricopeptide (TPR) repeat protein
MVSAALLLPATVDVWIDEEGHTYLTDSEVPPAPDAKRVEPGDLALQWGGEVRGERIEASASTSSERDRYLRSVFGARDDVLRGEIQRGLKTLRQLLTSHPEHPEAAYLLALVERKRGRLEPARDALETALRLAVGLPEHWRETATRLLREIEGELALADMDDGQVWRTDSLATPHFRISYDHQFAGREYGAVVASMLERARSQLSRVLGRELSEPLEVRLYTKAHYLSAYEHRFGFSTIGFYDGAIHVVSARHPREELYALVVHEYAHALFSDALGGHRPFFLNEGIAEREEAIARGREQMSRGEWRRLLDADRSGDWIPLASILHGFGGLQGKRALLAYLESRAAVELIEERRSGTISRWMERCSAGEHWERALVAEIGLDLDALEALLRKEVRARFVADPLAPANREPRARSRPGFRAGSRSAG